MKIRPLFINGEAKREIKRVVDWAMVNRFSVRDIYRREGAPGDNPHFTCVIPIGYRCVFTVDQVNGTEWARHISISVLGDGLAPGIPAVELLLQEFGFTCGLGILNPQNTIKPDRMEQEQIAPGKVAVNIWQIIPK